MKKQPNAQQKYRKSQSNRGLVRFEIQVPKEVKEKFDEMVNSAAEEYETPWDARRRIAMARAKVFKEITENITHDFFKLKEQIKQLQDQVVAISPSFFLTEFSSTPLPDAIQALPDDAQQLKKVLAKTYAQMQQAKKEMLEYKQRAEQYLSLYEVATQYNDELQNKLENNSSP